MPVDHILSQMNQVRALLSYSVSYILTLFFHVYTHIFQGFSSFQVYWQKSCMHFWSLALPAYFIVLYFIILRFAEKYKL
jgi:uncharacterized membrane protein YhdT